MQVGRGALLDESFFHELARAPGPKEESYRVGPDQAAAVRPDGRDGRAAREASGKGEAIHTDRDRIEGSGPGVAAAQRREADSTEEA